MPVKAPFTPNDFKQMVPSPGGSFCDKFLAALNLPNLVYKLVAFIWNEDGSFTDEFKSAICTMGTPGTTPTNPGALPAPIISATDGAFSDKVQITWSSITGATSYDIYRGTVSDPNTAVVLGSVTGTLFEDAAVTLNTYYYYWVKSKNATQTSAFSQVDRGHAGTVSTGLPQITTLQVSKGIGVINFVSPENSDNLILVWQPVAGAEKYDIYRNNANDFGTASLIDVDRVPANNELTFSLGSLPWFVDCDGELVYYHKTHSAGEAATQWYFWVIAKKSSPASQSVPSNSDYGFLGRFIDGTGFLGSTNLSSNSDVTIPSGRSRVRFSLVGSSGGGGGGSETAGGAGGGGPVFIIGEYTLAGVIGGTSKLRVRSNPEADTAQAAPGVNGVAGPQTFLEYSVNGAFSDTIIIATADAGAGGNHNGTGGAGGTGSVHASVVNTLIVAGRIGRSSVSGKGGRGGNHIFNYLNQAARFDNPNSSVGYNGSRSSAGGGGSYPTLNSSIALGGKGMRGSARVHLA